MPPGRAFPCLAGRSMFQNTYRIAVWRVCLIRNSYGFAKKQKRQKRRFQGFKINLKHSKPILSASQVWSLGPLWQICVPCLCWATTLAVIAIFRSFWWSGQPTGGYCQMIQAWEWQPLSLSLQNQPQSQQTSQSQLVWISACHPCLPRYLVL